MRRHGLASPPRVPQQRWSNLARFCLAVGTAIVLLVLVPRLLLGFWPWNASPSYSPSCTGVKETICLN